MTDLPLKAKLWRIPHEMSDEIRDLREECFKRGVILTEQRLVQILLQRGLDSVANDPIRE